MEEAPGSLGEKKMEFYQAVSVAGLALTLHARSQRSTSAEKDLLKTRALSLYTVTLPSIYTLN